MEKAHATLAAGADVIVVGNQIEKSPEFLGEVSKVVRTFNAVLDVSTI
jgi:heptaprenylglyceryl phosphate synthase